MSARSFVLGCLLLVVLLACSESKKDDSAGDAGLDGAADGGVVVPDCTGDDDCDGGQICHPYAQKCVPTGMSCSNDEECPDRFYCEPSVNACLNGTTGAPCTDDDNCNGSCTNMVCGCDGLAQEQQLEGRLDVFLILDRSSSMGSDCEYTKGQAPPVNSKACYATYALLDYLQDVQPEVETRMAFQVMSLWRECNGNNHGTAMVPLTTLPVDANSDLVKAVDDVDFVGGFNTRIEAAFRGIAKYTAANKSPNREMIGVLVTDGDPNSCERDSDDLAKILSDHFQATGIRTYIIGMEGATESRLETWAEGGGAEPHNDFCGDVDQPCHYYNVGNGSAGAIEAALQAIAKMAVPLPCSFGVTDLEAPEGEVIDYSEVNVTFTDNNTTTTFSQVPNKAACPNNVPAWYYDSPGNPSEIVLCKHACETVDQAGDGARVDVVVGCEETVQIL